MSIDHILFIIVTVVLVVLLVADIIAVTMIILLVKSLKRFARRAEEAADDIGGFAASLSKRLAPGVASGMMAVAMKQWRKYQKKGGADE